MARVVAPVRGGHPAPAGEASARRLRARAVLIAGVAALALLSGCGEPWGPTDLPPDRPPDRATSETPTPRRALIR